MDLTPLVNALKELLVGRFDDLKRDIAHNTAEIANLRGQMDQTNYRLTDLHACYLDLGRRVDERFDKVDEKFEKVDERFQKVDERFERFEVRMDENFERFEARVDAKLDRMDGRIDRLVETVAPRHEMNELARRVQRVEQEVQEIKKPAARGRVTPLVRKGD